MRGSRQKDGRSFACGLTKIEARRRPGRSRGSPAGCVSVQIANRSFVEKRDRDLVDARELPKLDNIHATLSDLCEHDGPLGRAVAIGRTFVRVQLVEYLNERCVRLRAEQQVALADDVRGDRADPH